jgi:hypothetical protein
METLENVFLGMFLIGFLFTIVSAVMSGAFGHAFGEGTAMDAHGAHIGHMGGDVGPTAADGHAEVGWAQHDLSTFSPLSPTTISAFLAAAGAMGYISIHSFEWSFWPSILASSVAGVLFAASVFFFLAWMFRATQGTSMVRQGELVGAVADVSIAIPAGGLGEIAYVKSGQRSVRPARCADAAAIPVGAKVVIKSVSTNEFIVEETRESWPCTRSSPRPTPSSSGAPSSWSSCSSCSRSSSRAGTRRSARTRSS